MRINVNIEGADALTSRLYKLCNIENALLKGGEVVRAEAQANCPKDTGRLANSIVVQSEGGNSVLIGPTAEYGIYVEFGTGSKGDSSKPHTSKKGWVYFNERTGGFVYTTGQAPQPFLIPALYSQRDAVIAAIKENLNVYCGHGESSTLDYERKHNIFMGNCSYDDLY